MTAEIGFCENEGWTPILNVRNVYVRNSRYAQLFNSLAPLRAPATVEPKVFFAVKYRRKAFDWQVARMRSISKSRRSEKRIIARRRILEASLNAYEFVGH